MARDGAVVRAAQSKGNKVPTWAVEPMSARGDEFYVAAWRQLDTCRPFGEVIGPIPWTAIRDYARHYRLDDDVTEMFMQSIMEMDAGYLAIERELAEQRAQEAAAKARREARRHG